MDPTFVNADQSRHVEHRIAGKKITRITPFVDGIQVEGADRILVFEEDKLKSAVVEAPILPHGKFKLSSMHAIQRALPFVQGSLIRDPAVERVAWFAKKVWLQNHGELRPAFKVRIPTLLISELKDIWIDAEGGDVLRITPAAWFDEAPAKAFVYSPPSRGITLSSLQEVTLRELVSAEPGMPLAGNFIATKNCAHYSICKDGTTTCSDDQKDCATEDIAGAVKSQKIYTLSSALFGLENVEGIPSKLSISAPYCLRIPCAKVDVSGVHAKPIDGLQPASEVDNFVEIQAYFLAQSYFEHMRKLMGDPSWCLHSLAMDCQPDGRPTLKSDGTPVLNFHIFTNAQLPDLKVSKEDDEDPLGFINQLGAGRGTPDNPIFLPDYMRIANAAYVSGVGPDIGQYELELDEILGDLLKPYDYLIFFQDERDLAYDGDVVFHEFTHAVISTLTPNLATYILNRWGLASDPGAFNEGYADYFAASFTDSSQIGEYTAAKPNGSAEIGLRNLDNTRVCPQNISGEIHNDSNIWSAALWDIRQATIEEHGKTALTQLDGVFLAAIAQAETAESFADQSDRIIKALSDHPLFNQKIATAAQSAFVARGVTDCPRTYALVEPKKSLHLISPNSLGLKEYSPPPLQLQITLPQGATSFEISWRQFFSSESFLPSAMDENAQPLHVVVTESPIEWKYQSRQAVPYVDNYRLDLDFANEAQKARFENERWRYTHSLSSASCEPKTYYVSLLTLDNDYVLRDISQNIVTGQTLDESRCQTFAGCACRASEKSGGDLAAFGFFALLALYWIMRKDSKSKSFNLKRFVR